MTLQKLALPALAFGALVLGQKPASEVRADLDIARLKDYSAHRVSSDNPDPASNDDSKHILPGETLIMADLTGSGIVTHIWVTVADNEFAWPRLLRLRVYYDGHNTPSVDAPLGDFFAVGHGLERDLNSAMVRNSSFGRARNSYWPMPYRKGCRIAVTNEGNRTVSLYYYQVDYREYASLPSDLGYFHAYYRQERPAAPGRHYEFLNIRGAGHYVGTVLSVVQTQTGWFGEGDDLFYVDGERQPRIYGTGTEDYFSDAWGLRVTDGAWAGTTLSEGQEASLHFSAYRWHVPDPIPFTKSLIAEIEHAGWTFNADGSVRSGFEERPDYFSSVAFWYQRGVNEDLPEPPYGAARLPLGNAEQIAVEDSLQNVVSTKGKASVQREVDWAKDLLFFEAEGVGSRVDVPIDVAADGRYEVLANVAQAPDYGEYVVLLDGKLTNSSTEAWPPNNVPPPGTRILHNYAAEVYVARDRLVGWFPLTRGRHRLSFLCTGRDSRSAGYNLGIQNVILARVPEAVAQAEPAIEWSTDAQAATAQPVYRGKTLDQYLAKLRAAPASLRPALLRSIGGFGTAGIGGVGALAEALGEPDSSAREAAAWSLARIGPEGAAASEALAKLLTDASPRVRCPAALALQGIGPKASAAVPALIAALQDPVDYVRAAAARALGGIGAPAGARPLAQRLLSENESGLVRGSVLEALGAMGPAAKDALPALRQAIEQKRSGASAQRAIQRIEGKPVPSMH